MRIKTLRCIATVGLALVAACEPVAVHESGAAADSADAGAPIARAQIMRAMARTPDNVRMHRLENGAELAEIVSGFQHATVVTRGDGGLEQHCLTDPEEAVRLLEGRTK